MAEVDRLQIKIEAEAAQAFKNVDALVGRLRELARTTGAAVAALRQLGGGFSALNQGTRDFSQSFAGMEKILSASYAVLTRIEAQTLRLGDSLEELRRNTEKTRQSTDGIKSVGNPFKVLAIGAKGVGLVLKGVHAIISGAANALRAIGSAAISAASSLGRLAASALSKVASILKSIAGAARSAVSWLSSLARSGIGALGGALKGTVGRLTGFFRGIVRIAKYRAIRAAIRAITDGLKTGMTNMYQWSQIVGTEFAPTMDRIATSMLYLKNGFGAMFSPLVEYFAPIIDTLVDTLVEAFNWVQRLFAELTGKSTWTKAIRVQTQYQENTDDTAESVKKLRQEIQLMDFDELNNITENQNNDAGKSDEEKTPNPAEMFETVEMDIEPMEGTLWENIKKKLQDWLSKVGLWDEDGFNWGALGALFGKELRAIWDKFAGWFDGIDWGKVFSAVTDFISNFFQNLVPELFTEEGEFDFHKLGETVGNLLANRWKIFKEFWDKIEWGKVFAAITDTIDGLLDSLGLEDWITNGSVNWDTIKTDILNAIGEIASQVGDVLRSILPEQFFKRDGSLDWSEVGRSFAVLLSKAFETLVELIEKIDWQGIFSDIFDFFNGFTDSLGLRGWMTEGDNTINWDIIGADIGKKIGEWIASIDWQNVLKFIWQVLKDIYSFCESLVDNLLNELIPGRSERKKAESELDAYKGLTATEPVGPWPTSQAEFEALNDYVIDLYNMIERLRAARDAMFTDEFGEFDQAKKDEWDRIIAMKDQSQGDAELFDSYMMDKQFRAYYNLTKAIDEADQKISRYSQYRRTAASKAITELKKMEAGYAAVDNALLNTNADAIGFFRELYNQYEDLNDLPPYVSSVIADTLTKLDDSDWANGGKRAMEKLKAALKAAGVPEEMIPIAQNSALAFAADKGWTLAGTATAGTITGAVQAAKLPEEYQRQAENALEKYLNDVDWENGGKTSIKGIKNALLAAGLPAEYADLASRSIYGYVNGTYNGVGWSDSAASVMNDAIKGLLLLNVPAVYADEAKDALYAYISGVDWANGGTASAEEIKTALIKAGIPEKYAETLSKAAEDSLNKNKQNFIDAGIGTAKSTISGYNNYLEKYPPKKIAISAYAKNKQKDIIDAYNAEITGANNSGKTKKVAISSYVANKKKEILAAYNAEIDAANQSGKTKKVGVQATVTTSSDTLANQTNTRINNTNSKIKKISVKSAITVTAQQMQDDMDARIGKVRPTAIKIPHSIPVTSQAMSNEINKKIAAVNPNTITIPVTFQQSRAKINLVPGEPGYIEVLNFAKGGLPQVGTMFVAGEAGAEMVGNINGRTGVASGQEITGIGDAVWSTGGRTANLLEELINVVRDKNLTLSPSAALGRTVAQSQRLYARQTG